MGLSLALNTARASLLTASTQIGVSARNVAGATDPSYSRKIAALVPGGGTAALLITRATDAALLDRKLSATSASAGSDALLDGLQRLSRTVGDTADPTAPAARLGALNAAMQAAANRPDDTDLARAAVAAARDLAGSLNEAAATVHGIRADTDAAIQDSVARVNDLLGQFGLANQAVAKGMSIGGDISDALDDRDRILTQLSQDVGITTVSRGGGDLAIYTDGGVPLFDRTARTVSVQPTLVFVGGTVAAAVQIDGVPVTGAASPMPLGSGRLAGLAALRDEASVRYESQLDAMAGGLVAVFAEPDHGTSGAGPRAGLFAVDASATLPGSGGAAQVGLATRLRVASAVDPGQGGDPARLRDGGINGADYRDPAAGAAAYSGRLRVLTAALTGARSFDPSTQITGAATLQDFAAASAGWLEAARKGASTDAAYQTTLLGRATDALSNAVGVNGDDETALTLRLEQSYTASAKLLTVVNDLLNALFDAVR